MAHNNLSALEDAPARPIDHGGVARSFVVGVLALWRINLEIGTGVRLALSGIGSRSC